MTDEDEISRILADYTDPDEPKSRLWRDLAKWVFAQDPKLVDGISEAAAKKALDDAAARVNGLKTAADWGSAARYFRAENFHDLEGPAAARAVAIAQRAARGRTAPSRRGGRARGKKLKRPAGGKK